MLPETLLIGSTILRRKWHQSKETFIRHINELTPLNFLYTLIKTEKALQIKILHNQTIS